MNTKEFLEKYGEETVKFDSYYKYTFTFTNDKGLSINCGGDASDIYKFDIEVDKEYTVAQLYPNSAYLNGECLLSEYW